LRRFVYVCEQEISETQLTGNPAGLYGVILYDNDITASPSISGESMTLIDNTRFSRVLSVFRGGNDYSIAFRDDMVN